MPDDKPVRHDAAANLAALENQRIRSMQPEQVPLEDGVPKQQLGLFSAYIVNAVAFILPIRWRVRFVFLINFLYNNVRASFRMLFAWFGQLVTSVSIWLAYFAVLGPTSWLARAFGADYLGERRDGDSFFDDKEPPDVGEERFARQY